MVRTIRLSLAGALVALLALPATGSSSTPPASPPVQVPATAGQTVTRTWTGVIPPSQGGTATSTCKDRPPGEVDEHDVRIAAPAGGYAKVAMTATFTITFANPSANNDEVLTVINKDIAETGGGEQEGNTSNEVGSSDTSSGTETVTGANLPTATYAALACGFINLPGNTPYQGKLVVATKPVQPPLASAGAQGMSFSASVPADPQRDEGEPLIQIAPDGTTYTCGPTGFSNASDYAQVSTDGGKQFHLMGEPPRGQQGTGGGGDCALATAPTRNAGGAFNYSYSGLGPLTNFTTSTSADNGHTLVSSPQSGATIPGVDRQWETFLDTNTVLLNYNQQAPRQVVVQKSTDGGLTFGVRVPGSAPNPDFPGPLRTLPASLNPKHNGQPLAYFPWSTGHDIDLSVSFDGGSTFTTCRGAIAPGQPTLFTTADSDSGGNIYMAYGENTTFHTYVTALHNADLAKCAEPTDKNPSANPGFSKPVQVDRDAVRSTVFPWLVAGGAPGRVAVAFYGSETDGDPNSGEFKGSWNVYVNQSLNALSTGATFSQTKATTHPIHYDSICLNGLGCDVSGGDRSLADFFAIGYDRTRRILQVVYDTTYKIPGQAEGSIATPTVVSQVAGPSNGGGSVTAAHPAVLRSSSADAKGDGFADYSSLGTPPSPKVEPAADFRSVSVGAGPKGGFRVTMKLDSLSDANLQKAVGDSASQRIIWVFRWFNGYRAAAAQARWSPANGFQFGYNDYTVAAAQCGSSSDKCLQYPGDQAITGKADQATGTLTLDVPASKLKTLKGGQGPGQRPAQVAAQPGDRLFDGTAFSLGDASPTGGADQSYMYPMDNAPAMDFLVPGGAAAGGPGAGGAGGLGNSSGGINACGPPAGLRDVAVVPRGRGVRIAFKRTARALGTRADAYQESLGRRIGAERRVASFTNHRRSFTWNGRANRKGVTVRDGYVLVQLRTRTGAGTGVRSFTLLRRGGRYLKRPAYTKRSACVLLRTFRIARPVFGGTTRRRLGVAVRIRKAGRVRVTLRHNGRVVRKLANRKLRAGGRIVLHVRPRRLSVAAYRVRVDVRSQGKRRAAVLTARRL
jgi:hypothetical protein